MTRLLLALLLLPAVLMAQDTTDCATQEGLQYDLDGDMLVGVGDLVQFLSWFNTNFDVDQDGVRDCEDECVGVYDTCGVCNGPGPQVLAIDTIIITYDSIYVDAIDEWLAYELDRDTLLHIVCENPGCTDPLADNFDPYAEEGGVCNYLSCFGPTFDGYTYVAVEIGDQCWFAENLRTTTYANGDLIPAGLTDDEWMLTTSGATAVYGEGSSSCNDYSPDIDACDEAQSLATYGRLYNWYAVDDARGLCPSGWHVPTDEEWMVLEMELGMSESEANSTGWRGMDEGPQLQSTSGWYNNGNGTDDFGFSAHPGGNRSYVFNGDFVWAGQNGYWWSSSPDGGNAWRRYISYSGGIIRSSYFPRSGFSVRCLRED